MTLSAVIFVHDLTHASAFYAAVLGANPLPEDSGNGWVGFAVGTGRLWLHTIPSDVSGDLTPSKPREETPIKLVLPISRDADLVSRVQSFGGQVISRPWGDDYVDPEGNVFAIKANPSA